MPRITRFGELHLEIVAENYRDVLESRGDEKAFRELDRRLDKTDFLNFCWKPWWAIFGR